MQSPITQVIAIFCLSKLLFLLPVLDFDAHGLLKDFLRLTMLYLAVVYYIRGNQQENTYTKFKPLDILGLGPIKGSGLGKCLIMGVIPLLLYTVVFIMESSKPVLAPQPLFIISSLLLGQGLLEEAAFRGYIFGHLRRRYSFIHASLATSIVFGGMHIIQMDRFGLAMTLYSMVAGFIISAFLCLLVELNGGLVWGTIVVHLGLDSHLVFDFSVLDQPQMSLVGIAPYLTIIIGIILFQPWRE